MCDMQILLVIEVSVLCLATNGALGDFEYHLFCVIFIIFLVCFAVTFEIITKTLQFLKKIYCGCSRSYFDLSTVVVDYYITG